MDGTPRWYWIGICLFLVLFGLSSGQSDEDGTRELSWQLSQDERLNLTADNYMGSKIIHVNTTTNLRLLVIVRLAQNCLFSSPFLCGTASWTWEQDTLTLFGPTQQTGTKLIHYLSSSNAVNINLFRRSSVHHHQYWIQVIAVQTIEQYDCNIINTGTEDGEGSDSGSCRFQNEGRWNYYDEFLAYIGTADTHSGILRVHLPYNTASDRRLLEFLYSLEEDGPSLSALLRCPYAGNGVDIVEDVNLDMKCEDTWSLISLGASGVGYIAVKRIIVYTIVDGTREETTTEGTLVRPTGELAATTEMEYSPTNARVTSTEPASSDNQSGLPAGAIAAVVVVVILALIALLTLGIVIWFRRRNTSQKDGASKKLDEGRNVIGNNSYTNPGKAVSNNKLADPPIYNDIAEGEYNVLFEGNEYIHALTANKGLIPSSDIQSDVGELPSVQGEIKLLDKPHQDKTTPRDDDYQIPQVTPGGNLYQALNSPSAPGQNDKNDLQDSDEAYDTLQRNPDGKTRKPPQTVTGLENYQTLDLSQNRDCRDNYETPDKVSEPDRPKTSAGRPAGGNDYETPESSSVTHQGTENAEKRGESYDTLQRTPKVQPVSNPSPVEVNVNDDYETPVSNNGSNTYQTLSSSQSAADVNLDSSLYHHLQRPLQQRSPFVSLAQTEQQEDRDYGKLDLAEDNVDRGETHAYAVLEKPSGQIPNEDPTYFVLDNSSPEAIDL